MPLFGRKARDDTTGPPGGPAEAAEALGQLIESAVTDADGRIRVEDLLSAGGAVCGEACIAAAGEFDPESHDFVPGSAVLSDRVNEILCGNATEWAKTGDSVFGLVFAGAIRAGYVIEDFPILADVFRVYLAGLGGGNADRWGYVALSVPGDNWPRMPPLRAAYELRGRVRAILDEHSVPRAAWPAACGLMVARELGRVHSAIDRGIGGPDRDRDDQRHGQDGTDDRSPLPGSGRRARVASDRRPAGASMRWALAQGHLAGICVAAAASRSTHISARWGPFRRRVAGRHCRPGNDAPTPLAARALDAHCAQPCPEGRAVARRDIRDAP